MFAQGSRGAYSGRRCSHKRQGNNTVMYPVELQRLMLSDPVQRRLESGQIKVNDQPLRNVFAEIERQYDVTIQFGESTGAKDIPDFIS